MREFRVSVSFSLWKMSPGIFLKQKKRDHVFNTISLFDPFSGGTKVSALSRCEVRFAI
jgi:hypothetical protein